MATNGRIVGKTFISVRSFKKLYVARLCKVDVYQWIKYRNFKFFLHKENERGWVITCALSGRCITEPCKSTTMAVKAFESIMLKHYDLYKKRVLEVQDTAFENKTNLLTLNLILCS